MPFHTRRSIKGICLLLVYGIIGIQAKVYSGLVSSKDAWQDNGVFITKFCFHGMSVNANKIILFVN